MSVKASPERWFAKVESAPLGPSWSEHFHGEGAGSGLSWPGDRSVRHGSNGPSVA